MLSITPLALHSLHSICSGGVSVSGGALGLSLDVCMCQQGGEVDRTRGSIVGNGEILSVGVSVLFSSWFSLRFWHDCVEPCHACV